MDTNKIKLLLVDDEVDICVRIQSYLGRRGFLVSTTGSGLEALSIIKASRPDIVILDIALNELDGLTALKRLREYDKETKVIIITGKWFPDGEVEQLIKSYGISHFKDKPQPLEQITGLVYQTLGITPPVEEVRPSMPDQSTVKQGMDNKKIVHKLANLLGIISGPCENFTMNLREGLYKNKTQQELIDMSVEIMEDIQRNVKEAVKFIYKIKGK